MILSVSAYTLTSFLLVAVVVALSMVVGDVAPYLDILAFPVNVVLMLLWLYGIVDFYRRYSTGYFVRYLLSSSATLFNIALLAVVCIVAGLQSEPATTHFAFVAALLYSQTQITMVTLRGWRNGGGVRWLFILCHLGLWLVLSAGLWGAPDSKIMRIEVAKEPNREAVSAEGVRTYLDYPIVLSDLQVDYYDNGTPSDYRADVVVADVPVTLRVNHPYSVRYGEDIYLVSVDKSADGDSVILQIVCQPWRGVALSGIVLLLIGAVLMFFRGPKR